MDDSVIDQVKDVGATPRELLDGLGLAAAILDARSGQILHVNDLFCQALQRKLDEVLKVRSLHRLIHSDDRVHHLVCTDELAKGIVERSRFEARFIKADGGLVRLRAAQSGVRDRAGQLVWVTLVLDDLTEPERYSREEPGSFAAGSVAIWSWCPEPGNQRTPTGFEILFGKIEGMQPASLENFKQRIHPDDLKSVEQLLRRSERGLSGMQDYRRLVDNARVRWVREMVTPVKGADGLVTNVIGMSIDITDDRIQKSGRKFEEILSFIRHLQTHWDEPLVLSAVARRYNLGMRSMQKYFAALGTTPLEFIKRIRLVHAYDMLSEPGVTTTVTKVCAKCGFGNLGHFARDYRTEFGELPSETLLRARASQRATKEAKA